MHVGVDVGVQAGPADVAPTCGAETSDETLVDALETPVKALVDAVDASGDARDAVETPEAKGDAPEVVNPSGSFVPSWARGEWLETTGGNSVEDAIAGMPDSERRSPRPRRNVRRPQKLKDYIVS